MTQKGAGGFDKKLSGFFGPQKTLEASHDKLSEPLELSEIHNWEVRELVNVLRNLKDPADWKRIMKDRLKPLGYRNVVNEMRNAGQATRNANSLKVLSVLERSMNTKSPYYDDVLMVAALLYLSDSEIDLALEASKE